MFLQNKSKIIAFDDLVNVCEDFYSLAEVDAARNLMIKFVPGKRIPKATGSDGEKIKEMLINLLKVIIDTNLSLSTFYAVDITRLPPVDIKHVDVSSLLSELSALRTEVRNMHKVQDEVCKLRQSISDLAQARCQSNLMRVQKVAMSESAEYDPSASLIANAHELLNLPCMSWTLTMI